MPMDRRRYPEDWEDVVLRVRARAAGRCECRGECGVPHGGGRCEALHGDPLSNPSRFVVLTSAHLWRGPCAAHHAADFKCGELTHLLGMCQACHLRYDIPLHVANARRTRHARRASGDLFD